LLKHEPEGCNFVRDGLLEFRTDLLKKCPVFGLGLGNANFDMGAAVGLIEER
jgi:hypothetical protein